MKNENKSAGERSVIYLIAIIIGFAVTFGVLLVFALFSTFADLNEAFATPFASLSLAAGGFTAGLIASKRLKRGGLINGVICGGVIFTVVLLISLAIDEGGLTINTLFNMIITLLSAVIGGIIGTNRKSKTKGLI